MFKCKDDKLSFLGPGIPMHFKMLRFGAILFLILTVGSAAFNIITSILFGTACLEEKDYDYLSTSNVRIYYD